MVLTVRKKNFSEIGSSTKQKLSSNLSRIASDAVDFVDAVDKGGMTKC